MQPIDARLIKKIDELVKDSVKNVNERKRQLTFYIKSDKFSGAELPPKTNRRFYPLKKTIRSHMIWHMVLKN